MQPNKFKEIFRKYWFIIAVIIFIPAVSFAVPPVDSKNQPQKSWQCFNSKCQYINNRGNVPCFENGKPNDDLCEKNVCDTSIGKCVPRDVNKISQRKPCDGDEDCVFYGCENKTCQKLPLGRAAFAKPCLDKKTKQPDSGQCWDYVCTGTSCEEKNSREIEDQGWSVSCSILGKGGDKIKNNGACHGFICEKESCTEVDIYKWKNAPFKCDKKSTTPAGGMGGVVPNLDKNGQQIYEKDDSKCWAYACKGDTCDKASKEVIADQKLVYCTVAKDGKFVKDANGDIIKNERACYNYACDSSQKCAKVDIYKYKQSGTKKCGIAITKLIVGPGGGQPKPQLDQNGQQVYEPNDSECWDYYCEGTSCKRMSDAEASRKKLTAKCGINVSKINPQSNTLVPEEVFVADQGACFNFVCNKTSCDRVDIYKYNAASDKDKCGIQTPNLDKNGQQITIANSSKCAANEKAKTHSVCENKVCKPVPISVDGPDCKTSRDCWFWGCNGMSCQSMDIKYKNKKTSCQDANNNKVPDKCKETRLGCKDFKCTQVPEGSSYSTCPTDSKGAYTTDCFRYGCAGPSGTICGRVEKTSDAKQCTGLNDHITCASNKTGGTGGNGGGDLEDDTDQTSDESSGGTGSLDGGTGGNGGGDDSLDDGTDDTGTGNPDSEIQDNSGDDSSDSSGCVHGSNIVGVGCGDADTNSGDDNVNNNPVINSCGLGNPCIDVGGQGGEDNTGYDGYVDDQGVQEWSPDQTTPDQNCDSGPANDSTKNSNGCAPDQIYMNTQKDDLFGAFIIGVKNIFKNIFDAPLLK